jgi:gamma-glutamyltranspeptidase/glutathione hydrolase
MPQGTLQRLSDMGHEIVIEAVDSNFAFGGAQLILKGAEGSYIAGSDPRKDGQAVAF